MRVVVAIEAHFCLVNGMAYSSYLGYDRFWRRYREVFDSVLIIARATELKRVSLDYEPVTVEGVELAALPTYHGPYQFVRKWPLIRKIIREVLRDDDACILRVSGNVGTQVWKQLKPSRPFGVEVMSDPWDAFAPGSVKSLGRPFYRWLWTRHMKLQCQQALAASYVTEFALQRRYPANKEAYTTHYSSVDLDTTFVLNDLSKRLRTIETIPRRLWAKAVPVRLGFIGTFAQAHKLPDVHIKALAQCVANGANVTLEMIGDGALLPEMKQLARKLGVIDRVIFRGQIPSGEPIMDAIDTFDLFLNATAAEGLPRVVIEAMSRGCPCIASNVAGTPELLEPDYLVPPHDVNALANKILAVIKNPAAMVKAAKRNIGIARNYCKDVLQPRRQAFYRALRERTEKYLTEDA
jgi:glycosyltransferase involved in cell wall biosynthesis